MEPTYAENKYCVVQFLRSPSHIKERYVCVPSNWLRLCSESGLLCVVLYPNREDPEKTSRRIRKRQKWSKKWKVFEAKINYGSDSYDDANNWIKTHRMDDNDQHEKVKEQGGQSIPIPENNTCSSKQNIRRNNTQFVKPVRDQSPSILASANPVILLNPIDIEVYKKKLYELKNTDKVQNAESKKELSSILSTPMEKSSKKLLQTTHYENEKAKISSQESPLISKVELRDCPQSDETSKLGETAYCQSYKSQENKIAELSENNSLQHSNRDTLAHSHFDKFAEVTHQRACLKPITQNHSDIQNLPDLINKSSPLKPPLTINGNHLESHARDMAYVLRSSSSTANKFRFIPELSSNKYQPQVSTCHFQEPNIQTKLQINEDRSTTGKSGWSIENPLKQSAHILRDTNNTLPAMQHLSTLENQASELHVNQSITINGNYIHATPQQLEMFNRQSTRANCLNQSAQIRGTLQFKSTIGSHEREIIQERCPGADNLDERPHFESNIRRCPLQDKPCTCHSCDCSFHIEKPIFQEQLQRDPRPKQVQFVESYNGGKCIDKEAPSFGIKQPYTVPNLSNVEKQPSQFRPSHEYQTTSSFKTYPQLTAQNMVDTRTTGGNYIDRGPYIKSSINCQNQLCQSPTCCNEQQISPSHENNSCQCRGQQNVLIERPNDVNRYGQNCSHAAMSNTPLLHSFSKSGIQSSQASTRSHEKHCTPVARFHPYQRGILLRSKEENYRNEKNHLGGITEHLPSTSQSPQNTSNQMSESIEYSNEERFRPLHTQGTLSVKRFFEHIHAEQSVSSESITTTIQNSQNEVKELSEEHNEGYSINSGVDFMNNFRFLLRKLHLNVCMIHDKYIHVPAKFTAYYETLDNLNRLAESYCKLVENNISVGNSKAAATEFQKATDEKQKRGVKADNCAYFDNNNSDPNNDKNDHNTDNIEHNDNTDHNNDNIDVNNDNSEYGNYDSEFQKSGSVTRTRRSLRPTTSYWEKNYVYDTNDEDYDFSDEDFEESCSFVLPPEYNPDDTKWTLKYREPAPDLVELKPGSGVLINATQLEHCKTNSEDSKRLASMLLTEIFSETALGVCSFTGARPVNLDVEETSVRPGLDEDARTVLLSFIEEYSVEKGWNDFNKSCVLSRIRNKIHAIRLKRSKRRIKKKNKRVCLMYR